MTTLAAVLAMIGAYLLAPQLFPRGTTDAFARATHHIRDSLSARRTAIRRRLLAPLRDNRLETHIHSIHKTATVTTIVAWTIFCLVVILPLGEPSLVLLVVIMLSALGFAGVYWLLIEPQDDSRFSRRFPRLLAFPLLLISFPLIMGGTLLLNFGWITSMYVCVVVEVVWLAVFSGAYFLILGQLYLARWAARQTPDRAIGIIGFLFLVAAVVITILH